GGAGEEADGHEHQEPPADAVGDDVLPVPLRLAERVEEPALGPRRHDDPAAGVVEALLHEAADEPEGEARLQRAPALRDHVDVDALAVEVAEELGVVARREVVPGEEDLRPVPPQQRRRERPDDRLGPEVRPADADAEEDVGALADLGGGGLDVPEEGAGGVEEGAVGGADAGGEVGAGLVGDEGGDVPAVEAEHGRGGGRKALVQRAAPLGVPPQPLTYERFSDTFPSRTRKTSTPRTRP